MSYLSALKTFVENEKDKTYSFKKDMDYGFNKLIISLFIDRDNKLSMGVDDCGYLFTDEIYEEDVAQMIVEYLFEVEGRFVPTDD